MALKKKVFFASIFAVALNFGIAPLCAFAESTSPPAQTDTDNGGGGNGGDAGNGGSGLDGGNEAGSQPTPASCYVVTTPTWFPEGPPVSEFISKINPFIYQHIVYYDTYGTYWYGYMSSDPASLAPIPGTYETWVYWPDKSAQKPQAGFQCED